jgi:hypothetical protein
VRAAITIVRVVAVGGAVGAICALAACAVAAASGLDALAPEMTLDRIVAAALVGNVAGAACYLAIAARWPGRATRLYALLTLGVASAASVRVIAAPPLPGFAAVAVPIHYVVAVGSALAMPWFLSAELTEAPRFATRALVTLVALATCISPEIADFNATHLENPLWPAHARYHGVLLACAMVVAGSVAIAMVWRPCVQAERRLRVAIATGFPAALWAAFFVALAFPDASSWPDGGERPLVVAPNVILAAVLVAISAVAWRLDRRS